MDFVMLCPTCRHNELQEVVKDAHLVEKEVCAYHLVKFPRARECTVYDPISIDSDQVALIAEFNHPNLET